MTKKKEEKKKKNEIEDVIFEEEVDGGSSFTKTKTEKKLKEKIKKLEEEKREYLEGWQRERAEMANLKKRHGEEKKLFTALGKEALIMDLVPILDNFEAAFSNKEAWEKVDKA